MIPTTKPFAITVSPQNFTVTVGKGEIIDSAGTVLQVAEQTLTLLPNLTQHIVLTLERGTMFALRRNLHDGSILLASVTTGETGVTGYSQPNEFPMPLDKLARTKAKLRGGEPVKVLILGTSLMNYTLGAPNVTFQRLLFDSTTSAAGYNVPGAANVTRLSYSQGSTGPHFSWAMLARPIGSVPQASGVASRRIGMKVGPGQMIDAASPFSTHNNWLESAADLVIIDGYNYGAYLVGTLEAQLRQLAARGCDIILMNTGPNTSDATYRYDQGPAMKAVCDANGFTFCDLNAFQRSQLEIQDNEALWQDGVHPSQSGNEFYAARLRDLLNDYQQQPALLGPARRSAYRQEIAASYRQRFPEISEIFVNAVRTTGAVDQATLASSSAATINPLVVSGNKTSSNTITILNTGEYVLIGHPLMLALDLMVEVNPGVNASITLSRDASIFKTVTFTFGAGSYGTQGAVIELLTVEDMLNTYATDTIQEWFGYTSGGFGNSAIEIANTAAGDLRVIGAVVHTVKHRDVALEEWGRPPGTTFVKERSYWNATVYALYSDTTNDEMVLSYFGRGICLVFQRANSAGQIAIVHDGVATTTDLYQAGATISNKYYLAAPQVEAASGEWQVAPQWHTVSVKLTGVNGSASATSTGLRRLTLLGAYVIE